MKLDGIRVLDMSSFLPGPYLTLAMADHGADVVKIEAPGGGDPGRHIGMSDGPDTVFFRNLNRGKKSLVLDLKAVGDREILLGLAQSADVVVESWRPGVADRLGVGYEALSSRNPRIVYCSISAFGQDGPYAARPAHDLALEALSGVLSMNVGADGQPAIPALPMADVTAGLQGLAAVLMALLARERTGRGDYVDISMHEALVGSMLNILGPTLAEGRQPDPREERTTGGAAFYSIYELSDGTRIVLAGQEKKFIENLLGRLSRLDLAGLCERGPGPHQEPVKAFLRGTFSRMSLTEVERMLGEIDVCWAPVKTMPEALEDPQLFARGFIVKDEQGRRWIASPIRFRNEPARPRYEAPGLDADAALARRRC
jgi:crotonobetainyl-CoA:carnitine CoA-transferase CaiB-like acyl-CoA transferase